MALAVNQLSGFGAGGIGEVADMTINFEDHAYIDSAATAFTFSDIDIGSTDAARSIILCAQTTYADGQRTDGVTCTIDGTAMTLAATAWASGGQNGAIFYKAFPSETTADFIVTWSGAVAAMAITVYKVTDLGAVLDTGAESGGYLGSGDPFTDNVAVAAGGVAVAISGDNDGEAGGLLCSWTNLTEDVDQKIGGYHAYSGASAAISSTSASLAITADWTGSPDNGSIVIASFEKG